MRTPGGRMPWFSCSILACSASRTADGFSPRRMSTMPSTASGSRSRVTTPRRGKAPTVTRARSRMRIGMPPRAATTTCSMSPAPASVPRPRTTVLLVAVLDVVAAGVGVRAPERLVHLVQRDAARLQPLGVDLHLVLLHDAAEGDHVGDARHLLQMPLHHPVLELAQLHGRVAVADQRVAVDLAGRGGKRAERRL